VKLTIIGCAGSFANAESAGSSYLLEHDGYSLLLDLGNGALGSLARYTDVADIDAVALSHVHLDHCADVGGLYVARRYDPRGQAGKIPVFGPPGVAARMDEIYGLTAEDESTTRSVFDFVEYDGTAHTVGPFTIESVPVVHCLPAFALRVSAGGRTLTYSGDTGYCQALIDASVGADVALYEASYVESADNPVDMHLTGAEGGRAATEAGVERLILTHLVAWNDDDEVLADARSTYRGDLMKARPGLSITV
jgi:ribonuclease BN (tRNA processing enzyme)